MSARLGAVLAGGASRRFGGDKALAKWRGKALIEHALASLRPHCDGIAVIGRDWKGLISAPDHPAPDLGPLGGILGALHVASNYGYDSVLTVPCDVPAPPQTLFHTLHQPPSWCVGHPVFGHWPVTLLDPLTNWLGQSEDRSVRSFAASVGAVAISCPDPITDIDTMADLEALT